MKIGFAFCGSFCNHPELLKIYEQITQEHEVVPILSENAAKYDTRFGRADAFVERVERVSPRAGRCVTLWRRSRSVRRGRWRSL